MPHSCLNVFNSSPLYSEGSLDSNTGRFTAEQFNQVSLIADPERHNAFLTSCFYTNPFDWIKHSSLSPPPITSPTLVLSSPFLHILTEQYLANHSQVTATTYFNLWWMVTSIKTGITYTLTTIISSS